VNHGEAELTGAYVLDALPSGERISFEAHLATCEDCQAEVAVLRGVVEVLPLATQPIEPPEALRQRILTTIAPSSAGELTTRRQTAWWQPLRFRPVTVLAAVAVAAIAILGVWNWQLQQRVQQTDRSIAFQQLVNRAIVEHATISAVPGTSSAPSASAVLIQPRHQRPAYFIVQDLPTIPVSKVYELWLVPANAAPRAAAIFTYRGNQPKVLSLPLAATGYAATAVTIEPGPLGSRAPTGPKVLLATLKA
jgi:anti-sigma-K factor RskA